MIDERDIINAINRRLGVLLDIAEAALPASQFKAYRKSVFREFGCNGLERELRELLAKHHGQRNG